MPKKNPYDLSDFMEGLRANLDYISKHPEVAKELNKPKKIGNPYTIGARVISPEEWAKKQTERASRAADEWLKRTLNPRKDPIEAALKANGKRKDRLMEAEKLGKWEAAMKKISTDDWAKSVEAVGSDFYRRGVENKAHKVEKVVKELQPLVVALAETIDKMPQTTDADREKRMLAARKGMIEIGKKRRGITG